MNPQHDSDTTTTPQGKDCPPLMEKSACNGSQLAISINGDISFFDVAFGVHFIYTHHVGPRKGQFPPRSCNCRVEM